MFSGPVWAPSSGARPPSLARAFLEGEGCEWLLPHLLRRGPSPGGLGERPLHSRLLGWPLHAFPFTGHSQEAEWGAPILNGGWSDRSLAFLPEERGRPRVHPNYRQPQHFFSFPDLWTPGVPLTLHCPSLDSAPGLNRMGVCLYTSLGGGEADLPGVFSFQKCTGGILSDREGGWVIPFRVLKLDGQTHILEGEDKAPTLLFDLLCKKITVEVIELCAIYF